MLGLLGKKKGMTQVFEKDGTVIPVTVVQAGPCVVSQKKTKGTDGYNALQLAFEPKKPERCSKSVKGHFAKGKLETFRQIKEFRTEKVTDFEIGDQITVASFAVGDIVDVWGVTKGRGFQGVIKRHGKHGGPAAHGSDFHRRPGSIGMRTSPGRVWKNMRLPGHMGTDRVTIRGLKVVGIQEENNTLLIQGAVPGFSGGDVVVYNRKKDFVKARGKENNATSSAQ